MFYVSKTYSTCSGICTMIWCFFFAVGGTFLVSGSTDHYIRIYQMTPGPPEKIAELDLHNVSLILYLAFLL